MKVTLRSQMPNIPGTSVAVGTSVVGEGSYLWFRADPHHVLEFVNSGDNRMSSPAIRVLTWAEFLQRATNESSLRVVMPSILVEWLSE